MLVSSEFGELSIVRNLVPTRSLPHLDLFFLEVRFPLLREPEFAGLVALGACMGCVPVFRAGKGATCLLAHLKAVNVVVHRRC